MELLADYMVVAMECLIQISKRNQKNQRSLIIQVVLMPTNHKIHKLWMETYHKKRSQLHKVIFRKIKVLKMTQT